MARGRVGVGPEGENRGHLSERLKNKLGVETARELAREATVLLGARHDPGMN